MRRVVVTGVGMVTPCGATTEKSWEAITAGKSGIGPITLFDASVSLTAHAMTPRRKEPAAAQSSRPIEFNTDSPSCDGATAQPDASARKSVPATPAAVDAGASNPCSRCGLGCVVGIGRLTLVLVILLHQSQSSCEQWGG